MSQPDDPVPSGGPSVALALGCGGARGLAHIQVIEALDDLGIRPVALAGASIGAIMGAALASGLRGIEIRELVHASLARRGQVIGRLWKARPTRWADIASGGFGLGPYNLERILEGFLPDTVARRFEDLAVPFTIVATDYYGQRQAHLSTGDLRQAIAASAAIPGLFQPVMIGGRAMVDGGLLNPVPFDLLAGKADIVLGVDVVGGPEGQGTAAPGRIDALFGASQLMMQTIIGMKMKASPPDLLIRPDIHRFRVLDFLRAEDIFTATAATKDEVKRALAGRIEAMSR